MPTAIEVSDKILDELEIKAKATIRGAEAVGYASYD